MISQQIQEIVKNTKNMKLLYVEDNEQTRESTFLILDNLFSNILVAVDGRDALNIYKNNNDIDIIITDINMPNMNGIELCKSIKEIDDDISIFLLSAYTEVEYLLDVIYLGIDGYLHKPICPEQFFKSILKVTKRIVLRKENENYKHILEKKLQQQLADLRDKDIQLHRQSKLATMGEMIGNIAHQWRQPLNGVGATMMKLELMNEMQFNDNKDVQKIVDDTNQTLEYMSKTIDDFRNFFAVDKDVEYFYTDEVINEALSIVKAQLDSLNIKVLINNQDGKIKILGHKNELIQVILNLLNNAKDALVTKNNKDEFDKRILIELIDSKSSVIVRIKDNAGGIPNNIIEKIFDPYFTTKFKSKGTGIGLYMSKTIIEKDMQGSLTVKNNSDGAEFTIVLEGQSCE